jgi:plastocyanin
MNLVAGNTQTITVNALDTQGNPIVNPANPSFTSASSVVAEVDNQGTVVGLYLGTTTINVSLTHGGVTRTATVTVNVTGVLPNDVSVVASSGDYVFTPRNVAIQAGGSITWSFGGLEHTVIFNSASGAPAAIDGTGYNAAVSRTFIIPGNFSYYCRIHAGMTGQIVVR